MLDGAGVGSSNPEAIFLLVLSRAEGNPYTITPYSLLRTSKSLDPFFVSECIVVQSRSRAPPRLNLLVLLVLLGSTDIYWDLLLSTLHLGNGLP